MNIIENVMKNESFRCNAYVKRLGGNTLLEIKSFNPREISVDTYMYAPRNSKGFDFITCTVILLYRMSIKFLCIFKNLLQRQMKRQISESYYKMRRMYLSFLCTI